MVVNENVFLLIDWHRKIITLYKRKKDLLLKIKININCKDLEIRPVKWGQRIKNQNSIFAFFSSFQKKNLTLFIINEKSNYLCGGKTFTY